MKKNILGAMMLLMALFCATPAGAQAIKFGVKAGINVNSLSASSLENFVSKDNRAGFFVGGMVDVTVPILGFGVDASVLYENKSYYSFDYNVTTGVETKESKSMHYISLPINIKYTIGFGRIMSAYIATGPQFSFNLSKNRTIDSDYKDDSGNWIDVQTAFKGTEFAWNVGAGLTFIKHIRVGYNYNIPLGKTGDITFSDVTQGITDKFKTNTHQVSLTYIF